MLYGGSILTIIKMKAEKSRATQAVNKLHSSINIKTEMKAQSTHESAGLSASLCFKVDQ